jgi:hypothetical protein
MKRFSAELRVFTLRCGTHLVTRRSITDVTPRERSRSKTMEKTMTRFAIAFSTLALLGGAAFAQELVDTDGNGTYSLEELQAVYTDLSAEAYAALDTNTDGAIDADELQAAKDAGTLVLPQ